MTETEIKAFFEVIKAGSISGAAENLYITQPALSRKIKSLEEKLGYALFVRKKGQRNIELTMKGQAFVAVAHKWLNVWQESQEINMLDNAKILNIAAVGSVSSYILPHVFESISHTIGEDVRLCFHNYHSFESYQYVGEGFIDIALVSDDIYYKGVETIPAFQEKMVLVANHKQRYSQNVQPVELDPHQEIRLPWNPEFDIWHDFWFQSTPQYRMLLDQMNLLEYVLSWDYTWAIVPASVAYKMKRFPYVDVYNLATPPPARIIYYLKCGNRKEKLIQLFLSALNDELKDIPDLISFL